MKRVAMWSGPRSLSTAMMRAWENRTDTTVVDEPLYASYLAETGLAHPMRDEVLASQSTEWRTVVHELTEGPVDTDIHFQKHMAQHLLPSMGRDWLDAVHNCFLIRAPRRILASYVDRRHEVTLEDIGMPQLAELFDREQARRGAAPPVLCSRELQQDPHAALTALCAAIGVPFDERMLSWPAGPRDSDGVWAPHWYGNVETSTGFAPPRDTTVTLPPQLERIATEADEHYDKLFAARLLFSAP